MNIGERIRDSRKKKNLTQKQLAQKIHVSSQVMSNFERGYTEISAEQIKRIAEELDVTSDYLLGRSDDSELEGSGVVEIGERISILREKKNISQKELADRINVNKSVMNRIESGERPVRDEELKSISTVLGVTADYLLGNSDVPYPVPLKRFVEDPELNAWIYNMAEKRPEDIKRLKEIFDLLEKQSRENQK